MPFHSLFTVIATSLSSMLLILLVLLSCKMVSFSPIEPSRSVLYSCVFCISFAQLGYLGSRKLWVQFSSVSQLCPTLCDPMNRSTPGLPVHHQLLEFTQTHAQWVGDAIQQSHPLSSPFPPAPNPPQHQGLFKWVNSSMRWPKYWSFSFSISPSSEHPGLISFRMDWLDLLAVQGTLKSLLQHHSSKASIFRGSAFFTVQLSHPYMTTGKTIALTRETFVGKVMSLLFNMLSRLVITFLPRSKCLLISWLQSPSTVILEPKKKKALEALIISAEVPWWFMETSILKQFSCVPPFLHSFPCLHPQNSSQISKGMIENLRMSSNPLPWGGGINSEIVIDTYMILYIK